MAFKEHYYEKFDIFRIDKTGQQCFVLARPVRKRDDYWEYQVRLIDNDYSEILNFDGCQVGDTTMFISNAQPELHEFIRALLKKIFLTAGKTKCQSATYQIVFSVLNDQSKDVNQLKQKMTY